MKAFLIQSSKLIDICYRGLELVSNIGSQFRRSSLLQMVIILVQASAMSTLISCLDATTTAIRPPSVIMTKLSQLYNENIIFTSEREGLIYSLNLSQTTLVWDSWGLRASRQWSSKPSCISCQRDSKGCSSHYSCIISLCKIQPIQKPSQRAWNLTFIQHPLINSFQPHKELHLITQRRVQKSALLAYHEGLVSGFNTIDQAGNIKGGSSESEKMCILWV